MLRTSIKIPNSLGMQPRMTMSSASQGLKGKNDMPSKAASKVLLEEKTSRMGYAQGYSMGSVQGEDVTSALNASPNVLTTLIGIIIQIVGARSVTTPR